MNLFKKLFTVNKVEEVVEPEPEPIVFDSLHYHNLLLSYAYEDILKHIFANNPFDPDGHIIPPSLADILNIYNIAYTLEEHYNVHIKVVGSSPSRENGFSFFKVFLAPKEPLISWDKYLKKN